METNGPPGSATATKQFQCISCPKSYLSESSLKEHVSTKHVKDESQSCYTCEKCMGNNGRAKTFANIRSLNTHLSRVHGPRRFTCRVCLKTFKASSEFRRHEQVHLPKNARTHSCEYCSKTYTGKQSLQRHLCSVHNQKAESYNYLKCDLCSLEFMGRSKLDTHVARNHVVVDRAFECHVCSKTLSDGPTLYAHMRRHDRRTRYFCDVCSKGFKHKRNFIPHLEIAHKKLFYCDKCSRSFTNKSLYDTHLLPKSSCKLKLDLNCQICSETFDSQCDLDFHTNCHLEVIKDKKSDSDPERNREFQCQLCSKSFDRESYFRAHHNLEHPKAEWTCGVSQCSKKFKSYSLFILDKLKHEGTRPFVCPICQKSFYQSRKLKQHEQSHLQQRKYRCNKCPKSYMIPSLLRSHLANSHGRIKPFKCPINNCETSWATNSALNGHLASLRVEKLFKCEEENLRNPKLAGEVEFICCSKNCNFHTANEKDIAIHHYQQHQLPRILLFRNNIS